MKSSYELAMERLAKSAPVKKLSAEQKEKIQEIDSRYRAKIAECETLLRGKIEAAIIDRNDGEEEALKQELAIEIRRFEEESEEKKELVRQGKA
ncbi:MAG: hypothetical protein V4507_07630 [Verrucomicrobiota bacterium]